VGLTYVNVDISHPETPERSQPMKLLVDTGADLSIIPRTRLRALGIRPAYRQTFTLANGKKMRRDVGLALFRWKEYLGGAPVIFGGAKDEAVLGVLSLEAMGLEVSPRTRQLKPTRLLLA